jgi:hypothetical protein
MIRKKDMAGLIQMFEEKLKRYEEELRCDTDNLFYKIQVKQTRDFLEELYEEVRESTQSNLTLTSSSNAL